jgi:hypothetical protein
MPYGLTNLDVPMDAGLRPLAAVRQRSLRRHVWMVVFFITLCTIIWAYWTITDSNRVKGMAEKALSELVGGRVEVRSATLSIFEGLRLRDVRVYVDHPDHKETPLFQADLFLVKTNPGALLVGKIEPRQIMAIKPHLTISEDVDKKQWNYSLLRRKKSEKKQDPKESAADKPALPEILLRGGWVEYIRVSGGRREGVGMMAIDGQLTPTAQPDRYMFDLQSRAPTETVGPRLRGVLDMLDPPVIFAQSNANPFLENLAFDHAIRAMLPSQVEEWWERHQLAGKITVTKFRYAPSGKKGIEDDFHVEVELDRVRLAILPEELMGQREFDKLRRYRPGFPVAGMADIGVTGRIDTVEKILQPQPIALRNVSGRFVFTPNRIRFSNVTGMIVNNTVTLSGSVEGYTPEAAMNVQIVANSLQIPTAPRYIGSLPREVRSIYSEFKPSGHGALALELVRTEKFGDLRTSLELNIYDGAFTFHEFTYPLRHTTGSVRFGRDPGTGRERVDLVKIRGYGVQGTINHDKTVEVNGYISPINRYSAVNLRVSAPDVWVDQHIRSALPREAQEAVAYLDGLRDKDGNVIPLQARGSFFARVVRPYGLRKKTIVDVDVDIKEADGAYTEFAYPLRKATGKIFVRSNHVDLKNIVARNGPATLVIDGRIQWGKDVPTTPDVTVSIKNGLIDDDLFNAMPASERKWLKDAGIAGKLDAEGRIFLVPAEGPDQKTFVDWDFAFHMREGTIWPSAPNVYALSETDAQLRLTRSKLSILSAKGKRGYSDVVGSGEISWPENTPTLSIDFKATNLLLDKVLYDLIPQAAKVSWDELRPKGLVDLAVSYSSQGSKDGPEAKKENYEVRITPREMAVLPLVIPYRMEKVTGEILVTPGKVLVNNILARHDDGIVRMNGVGLEKDGHTAWDLAFSGEKLLVDDELRTGLPEGLGTLFKSLKLGGRVSFDCPNFTYVTKDLPLEQRSADKPDKLVTTRLEFKNTLVTLHDADMDTGMLLTAVNGALDLSGVVIDGTLYSLNGKMNIPALLVSERQMKNLRANIDKQPGVGFYRFSNMRGKLAGGELAGQVEIEIPEGDASSRYAFAAVLRGCDVRELAGEKEERLRGALDASIALEGDWSDPSARRGRGDIHVQGNDLYKIPVVLGLLQITNLSLPIKSPFSDATTHYIVEGPKVTFEQIELRAANMLMSGSGWLNFDSRRMAFSFTTDNPNWPKIPVIGELIQGAKRELFQIHVRGTIDEPQIKARSMNTFQTTIDEVFKGQEKPKKNGKNK